MAEITVISAGKVWFRWEPVVGAVRYTLSIADRVTGIPAGGRDTAPPKSAAAIVSSTLKPDQDYVVSIGWKDASQIWHDLAVNLPAHTPSVSFDHTLDRWRGTAATANDAFASASRVLYSVDESPNPGLYLRSGGLSVRLSDLTRTGTFYRLAVLSDGSTAVLERFDGTNAAVRKYSADGTLQWERLTGFGMIGAIFVTSVGNIIVFVLGVKHDANGNHPAAVLAFDQAGNQIQRVDLLLDTVWPGGTNAYFVKPTISENSAGVVHLFVKTDGAPWVDLYKFSASGSLLASLPKFLALWPENPGDPSDGVEGADVEMPVLSSAAVGDEIWLAYASSRYLGFASDFFAMVGPYSKPPEDYGEWNPAREINICRVSGSGAKAFQHPPAATERITCLSLSEQDGRVFLLFKRFRSEDQSFDEVYCTVWNGAAWCDPVYLGPGIWSAVHCSGGQGVWQDSGGMRLVDLTWIGEAVPPPSPAPPPSEQVTAAPIFSPTGGKFRRQVTVTLSCATPGAVIYFTLDGSTPTVASPRYAARFVLTSDTRVRAMAQAPGLAASIVASAFFDRKGNG